MTENYIYKGKNGGEVSYTLPGLDYLGALEDLYPDIKWFYGQDDDYSGYWWAAGVDKEGNWFSKQGTFGSCDVCDWAMGIYSVKEAEEFFADMERIDPIGKSKEEAIAYLEGSMDNTFNNGVCAISDLIKEIRKGCDAST